MVKTLAFGHLMTAFAAKGGAIIVGLIGMHMFGAPDTVLPQWIAAVLIAALGLAATAHEIRELRHRKGQAVWLAQRDAIRARSRWRRAVEMV